MTNRILVHACVCTVLAIAAPFALAKEPPRNRRAFAEAMSRVKEGMSQAEVLALIGKPDDVNVLGYPEWRYGVSQHLAPAMLGEVGFDLEKRVKFVSGQGSPPREGLFTEPELRILLELIYDLADDHRYNPRSIIRTVNVLQPLGKEKALAVVGEFLRVSSEYTASYVYDAIPLLLRTLFEVPETATAFTAFDEDDPVPPGTLPGVFGWYFPEFADRKLLPRYPIVIEGDIPFLIEAQGGSTGPGPMPEAHLAYYRKYGKLRAKPLAPTAQPFVALDKFMKSARWCFKKNNRVPHSAQERMQDAYQQDQIERQSQQLRDQLLRLLDTVHNFEPDDSDSYFSMGCDPKGKLEAEAKNEKLLADAAKLAIRWDPKASHYVRLDGAFVPPFDRWRHLPLTWQPAALRRWNIELVIKRSNRWYIELLSLSDQALSEKEDLPAANGVRVFDVKLKDKPIAKIDELPMGHSVRLEEGHEIQIELSLGKQTERSPILKP